MAEFCRSCYWKYIAHGDERYTRLITSDKPELCEGCGEVKPVVIYAERRPDKGVHSFHPMWR